MVGDQHVFKTPSANIAVAMANLERLPDTPEYQGIRSSIRAHLIAAMGQTADLLRRAQAISYMEVTSNQTHRSQASPRPGAHHHSRSCNDDRGKAARHDSRGRAFAVTESKDTATTRRSTREETAIFDRISPTKTPMNASIVVSRIEWRTKMYAASSTMPHTMLPA